MSLLTKILVLRVKQKTSITPHGTIRYSLKLNLKLESLNPRKQHCHGSPNPDDTHGRLSGRNFRYEQGIKEKSIPYSHSGTCHKHTHMDAGGEEAKHSLTQLEIQNPKLKEFIQYKDKRMLLSFWASRAEDLNYL